MEQTARCDAVLQHRKLSKTGMQERLFAHLFGGLVYPQIWEDPLVDMQALDIRAGEHLVCIASGGCNALSYLCRDPGSILAVDLSPAHVALNRLKLTAAQRLPDHGSFYQLFGDAAHRDNPGLIESQLLDHLDSDSRAFWSGRHRLGRRRLELFGHGFYRYGLLGRFIGAVHGLTRIDFEPLLQCTTLEQQRDFFEREVAPLFEHRLFRLVARQPVALFGLGIPPAQHDKLRADGGGDVLPVLRERTRKLMCDFPVAENYFAWQAFARRYDPAADGSRPPYLQAENFDTLRRNAARMTIVNRSLTDALRGQADASKHGYALLDAQDWMSDRQLDALWREITRTAAAGARVIFRTGGEADILPGRLDPELLGQWRRDPEASARGSREDRSAIYGGFHLYRRVACR